jgi:hypothetical protein
MDIMYMKKAIIIFLIFVFVTSSFGYIQGFNIEENSIDLIDQNNRYCTGCNCAQTIMLSEGCYIAQSFTPSHNILSKVLFFIDRSGFPPAMKLTLNIRETLDGDNLVSMEKETTGTEMIFDIKDINVISGNLYYIIIMTDDISTSENGYGLYKTIYNSYYRGSFWTKVNQADWTENTESDMLFLTYWKDYCPDDPMIDGPPAGKAQQRYGYTISTDDPDGDEVEYQIDWGDGITTNWYGPYESGEKVEIGHQWAYEDNYTIRVKARDIYGAESEWTSMEISMPKTKSYNNPFLRFLENHPRIFPILRLLLT